VSLPRLQSEMPRPCCPRVDEHTELFWKTLEDGKFLLAVCGDCSTTQFPPRKHCSACYGHNLDWTPASGGGVIYASTRVHAAGGPFAAMAPYTVGIIDLDEGVRILTRLMHDASSLPPGSRVNLAVIEHTDGPLFVAVNAA